MNGYRYFFKNTFLCSCLLFGIKNCSSGKEKEKIADKKEVLKKRQIRELVNLYNLNTLPTICENRNGENIVTYINENDLNRTYREMDEKKRGNGEKGEGQYNLNGEINVFVKEENKTLQDEKDPDEANENTGGCAFEMKELESEEMEPNELNDEMIKTIKNILDKHSVVLFMKGTALNPFCKYSKEAIHILKLNKVKEIHTVNILNDQELKKCLKIYSKWLTFPQLYVNGKFIGGIDELKKLHTNKQLDQILKQERYQ